jgi:hypothetical protein
MEFENVHVGSVKMQLVVQGPIDLKGRTLH